uniref:Tn3 family transposase n=1 Tax=Streptosporangium album TaxID=47479 RepID=UPI001616AF22|nr:Tn3 family transposase [Streptosporangium album]
MLKEAVLRTGCLNAVTSVAGSSSLKPEVLAERLMLAIFGYGTNTGIRAVASGGHAHSEDDIRYGGRGSSSTGTSSADPWSCAPRPCAPRPRRCTR